MEIKKGYKMTDVGVIPEDWEVINLERLGKFSKGSGISKSESGSGNIKAIRYGELYTIHDYIIKRYESFISKDVANKSKKLFKGDIVFACSGETKEDIGKCAAFIDDCEVYAGGDTIILSPDNITDSCYLGYILNSSSSIDQKSSAAQGDSVVHISIDSIKKILIPLPTLLEQQAVADALTKVDNLIMSLSKVIEKKKLIKKGTMQKLLSGEVRLDGFKGEWELKTIKDIAVVEKGELLISSQFENGKIEVWAGGKIPAGYHNVANRMKKTITISASGAYAGFVSYHNRPIYATDCSSISESTDYVIKFLYYCLINMQDKIYEMQTGGAQPHVHPKDIYQIELAFPSTKAEQTAIANVLTTMDDEIEKLEKEREKYKSIKQGMMQQLLTGKIRLTCQ